MRRAGPPANSTLSRVASRLQLPLAPATHRSHLPHSSGEPSWNDPRLRTSAGLAPTRQPHRTPRQINVRTVTILSLTARPSIAERIACIDAGGSWSYGELLGEALAWRDALPASVTAPAGTDGTNAQTAFSPGDRVAYLIPPGRDHVAVQLGIWLAGGIAVPLAVSHPVPELEYILDDARPRTLIADPRHPAAHPLSASPSAQSATVLTLDARHPAHRADTPARRAPKPHPATSGPPPGDPGGPAPHHPALLIYTSGTTGRPRGVLITHANLTAQITALTEAWGWTERDRILHTLPLHHIHGVVNALACALWSGAAVEFGSGAPASTWDRLASGDITLFMSVPTVYARLIRAWEEAAPLVRERWSEGAAGLRLMVSGSAALPASTLERWRKITGQTLLERYGMTEIGMALSNPLHGERRPGHVGLPLPGVELRLVDDRGHPVAPRGGASGRSASIRADGEIEVRGPQIFREYWRRPAETADAFRSGWFRTGDQACVGEGGYYRILGRRDVDIVKTGGLKVSALEVEDLYRTHPAVRDLAVVGVPHPEWGEQLCAAWVPAERSVAKAVDGPAAADGLATAESPANADGAGLRAWGKERLAPYKVPHIFTPVATLPRNAMGKVQKAAVRHMLAGEPGHRGDADPPSGRALAPTDARSGEPH